MESPCFTFPVLNPSQNGVAPLSSLTTEAIFLTVNGRQGQAVSVLETELSGCSRYYSQSPSAPTVIFRTV